MVTFLYMKAAVESPFQISACSSERIFAVLLTDVKGDIMSALNCGQRAVSSG